jgi:multidrug efflux pump subunit AcrB
MTDDERRRLVRQLQIAVGIAVALMIVSLVLLYKTTLIPLPRP